MLGFTNYNGIPTIAQYVDYIQYLTSTVQNSTMWNEKREVLAVIKAKKYKCAYRIFCHLFKVQNLHLKDVAIWLILCKEFNLRSVLSSGI
jgi:hypothetical protein